MQTYDRLSSSPPERFSYEVTRHNGWAVVRPSGELDLAGAPLLVTCLQRLEDDRVGVIIDLSQLSFCDSTGLTALIGFRNRAEEMGRRFVLCRPTRPVRRVFELTNTDRLLDERVPTTGEDRQVDAGRPPDS